MPVSKACITHICSARAAHCEDVPHPLSQAVPEYKTHLIHPSLSQAQGNELRDFKFCMKHIKEKVYLSAC